MSTGINVISTKGFQSEPQTLRLVGPQRNNGTGNGIQEQCHTNGLAWCGGFAACAMEGRNACGLPFVYRRTPRFTAKQSD